MRQIMNVYQRKDAERRIPVLKLEIDYELATLFDALNDDHMQQINKSKKRLEELRIEMLRLEA